MCTSKIVMMLFLYRYNVSPGAIFTGSWLAPPPTDSHPDIKDGRDAVITGKKIPDMKEAIDIVTWSHHMLMKDVPLVGNDEKSPLNVCHYVDDLCHV